jgi:hypothetical protein
VIAIVFGRRACWEFAADDPPDCSAASFGSGRTRILNAEELSRANRIAAERGWGQALSGMKWYGLAQYLEFECLRSVCLTRWSLLLVQSLGPIPEPLTKPWKPSRNWSLHYCFFCLRAGRVL